MGRLRSAVVTLGLVLSVAAGLWSARGDRSTSADAPLDPSYRARDLVAELPEAEVDVETPLIDLDTDAGRAHLVRGWSSLERLPDGTPFIWSAGPVSVVDFSLARGRDLVATLRCRPFGEGAGQSYEVLANGQRVDTVSLQPGLQTYTVALPGARLRAGRNRLEFRYAYTRIPAEQGAGSTDPRSLAVAWHGISLAGFGLPAGGAAEKPARPSATVEEEGANALHLPAGSGIAYYLKTNERAWLDFDALRVPGGAGCRLSITADTDAGAARRLVDVGIDAPKDRLPIAPGANGIVRLSLALLCAPHEGAVPVAVVERPRLWARSIAPHTAPARPAPSAPPATARARRPNVIVYLVDTLRADHLGCYGYPRPVSPNIDAFARESVLFTHARSPTSWTRPAVASLFTGLSPPEHGILGGEDALPPAVPALAPVLGHAGYRTAAVVTNGHVSATYGFARGFDYFDDEEDRAATIANGAAFRWLAQAGTDRPLFLYVHILEPHDSYDPPAPFRQQFAPHVQTPDAGWETQLERLIARHEPVAPWVRQEIVDLYDGEIATADFAFGQMLSFLRAHDLYESSLIVFCADHGEEFEDHGSWRHAHTLYEELLRVPLLIRRPGARRDAERREGVVPLADVFGTILAEAGVADAGAHGGNVLAPEPPAGEAPCFFHSLDLAPHKARAIRCGPWKLIHGDGLREELYDLHQDPGEQSDLSNRLPVRAGYLAWRLRAHEAIQGGAHPGVPAHPDPALLERLRAIGYAL